MPQDDSLDFVALVVLLAATAVVVAAAAARSPVVHDCAHGLIVRFFLLAHGLRCKGVARALRIACTSQEYAVVGSPRLSLRHLSLNSRSKTMRPLQAHQLSVRARPLLVVLMQSPIAKSCTTGQNEFSELVINVCAGQKHVALCELQVVFIHVESHYLEANPSVFLIVGNLLVFCLILHCSGSTNKVIGKEVDDFRLERRLRLFAAGNFADAALIHAFLQCSLAKLIQIQSLQVRLDQVDQVLVGNNEADHCLFWIFAALCLIHSVLQQAGPQSALMELRGIQGFQLLQQDVVLVSFLLCRLRLLNRSETLETISVFRVEFEPATQCLLCLVQVLKVKIGLTYAPPTLDVVRFHLGRLCCIRKHFLKEA
mmetsp:Transcript_118360/g.307448  ORF Transcript_118360/g.307448 Transcript_118360/m.307448 type:complete len:369 (+) Transcript_118360:181-1287(+)